MGLQAIRGQQLGMRGNHVTSSDISSCLRAWWPQGRRSHRERWRGEVDCLSFAKEGSSHEMQHARGMQNRSQQDS